MKTIRPYFTHILSHNNQRYFLVKHLRDL